MIKDSSKRLLSLDVFRGITIVAMILVNNPGSWNNVYPPLLHAEWHGWTPTDFIFPFFLFIMGVAMPFSLGKRLERGDSQVQLFRKIVRRTFIIFFLGLFLNFYWDFNLQSLRIPGVLQRIAVCYFFTSVIILKMNKKWQIGISVFILAGYWAALKLIPVHGFGTGILQPEGSLVWYIDKNLLAGHTWKWAPVAGFDPEGILSTFPAIVSVLLGVFTGDWLQSGKSNYEKVTGLFVFANIGLIIGMIINIWFPINKNLWTSSYVVFMTGMALHFLAMCYWLIDIKPYSAWSKPFIIFGANAIVAYFTSSLIAKTLAFWNIALTDGTEISIKTYIYKEFLIPLAGDLNGSLLYPIILIFIWLGFLYILYRKKIFIKI